MRRARSAPRKARGFVRVMVPVAMPGLTAGAALATGRALGEFGATLMFAGSFQGVTQTVPLAIYDRLATDSTQRWRSRRCWSPWLRGSCCPRSSWPARRRSGVLQVEAHTQVGAVELDVSLRRSGRMPRAGRAIGRGKDQHPAHRGGPPAPRAGHGALRRRHLARHRRRPRPGPGSAPLRLPLPGARALPSSDRVAQRGLPAARAAARRSAPRRWSCSGASGWRGRAGALPRTCGGRAPAAGLARALARRPDRCCSTSRSPPSTRARAPGAARELGGGVQGCGVPALLVTHDFAEAALLGDRVAVIDWAAVVQEGTAAELAAAPRHGLRGRLHRRGGAHGHLGAGCGRLHARALDGGGAVASTDA